MSNNMDLGYEMFCYQCEQTAGGKGCTKQGVCGKTAEVANLQDLLLYQLKGISVYAKALMDAGENPEARVVRFVENCLFTTLTNVNFDAAVHVDLLKQSQKIKEELRGRAKKARLAEPKAVQAVAFAQRLGKLTAETVPSARDFDEGKVAFRPFLFSDYRTYQPYPWRIKRYSDFSWDCIPMPHGPAGGNSSELSTVLAGISSRSANMTLAWQFLRELTANADNQSMLFTDSHSVSALRSVTDSDETRRILRQDTPGESRNGVEMLSDVMEQAVAAPRFRNYDQALLLTEGLVQNAMEDEHNLSLQLQRVQHEVQEYLQE